MFGMSYGFVIGEALSQILGLFTGFRLAVVGQSGPQTICAP